MNWSVRVISLFLLVFSLSSCYTGKIYHHSRVKVEATYPDPEREKLELPVIIANTSPVNIVNDRSIPVAPSKPSNGGFHSIKFKNARGSQLKYPVRPVQQKALLPKIEHVNSPNESILGFLGLVLGGIIGISGLLVVIGSLIFGLFGIMIGFWICWIIGTLALLFALFIGIVVSKGGFDDVGAAISIIAYSIFIILAIVFLLIVLL